MKAFRENLLANLVYPLFIVVVVGLGSWSWSLASDVTVLKEQVKQQQIIKQELSVVKETVTQVRIQVGKLETQNEGIQRSLDRIIQHLSAPPSR